MGFSHTVWKTTDLPSSSPVCVRHIVISYVGLSLETLLTVSRIAGAGNTGNAEKLPLPGMFPVSGHQNSPTKQKSYRAAQN